MTTSPTPNLLDHLLSAHDRIEGRLKELEAAADALAASEGAHVAVAAMVRVLEFFRGFGEQHQKDEERTLLARLRSLPDLAQMLDAFDFQHRMADDEQRILEERVRGFAPGREAELARMAHRYVEVQRSHMLAEERALFPMAEQHLSAALLAELGRELHA